MVTKNEASQYRLPARELYHLNENIHNPIIPRFWEIGQGGKQNLEMSCGDRNAGTHIGNMKGAYCNGNGIG